jgi:hypothetical protein
MQLNVPSRAGVSKSTARKVILKAASRPRDRSPRNRSPPASATSIGNLHGDSLAQPGGSEGDQTTGSEGDQDPNLREGDVDNHATGREQDVPAAHDGGDVCLTHQGDDCRACAKADNTSWRKTHVLGAGGECPIIDAEKSRADVEQGDEERRDEVPSFASSWLYLYKLTGSCFLQHIASRWPCGKEQFRLMRMACLQEYGSRYVSLRDTIMSLDGQARLLVAKTVFRYCHLCARLGARRRGAGAGAQTARVSMTSAGLHTWKRNGRELFVERCLVVSKLCTRLSESRHRERHETSFLLFPFSNARLCCMICAHRR